MFHDSNGVVSFFYIQEPGASGVPGIYGIKVVPGYAIPVEPGNVVDTPGLHRCTKRYIRGRVLYHGSQRQVYGQPRGSKAFLA